MNLACHCPTSYPDWDGKDISLTGQCIHRLPIAAFFHMPLAYETYTQRQQHEITTLELEEPWPGFTLTRSGMFGGEIIRLLDAATESPSRRVDYLPGNFHIRAKIHTTGIETIKDAIGSMQSELISEGKMPKELYLAYLSCPSCEKEHEQVIMIVRRWIESPRLTRAASRT